MYDPLLKENVTFKGPHCYLADEEGLQVPNKVTLNQKIYHQVLIQVHIRKKDDLIFTMYGLHVRTGNTVCKSKSLFNRVFVTEKLYKNLVRLK